MHPLSSPPQHGNTVQNDKFLALHNIAIRVNSRSFHFQAIAMGYIHRAGIILPDGTNFQTLSIQDQIYLP